MIHYQIWLCQDGCRQTRKKGCERRYEGCRVRQYGLPTLIIRIALRGFSKIGLESEVYLYCKRDIRKTKPVYQLPDGYSSCLLDFELLKNRSAIPFSFAKLDIFRKKTVFSWQSGRWHTSQRKTGWICMAVIEWNWSAFWNAERSKDRVVKRRGISTGCIHASWSPRTGLSQFLYALVFRNTGKTGKNNCHYHHWSG